jgi:5'-3' exonuclease
VYALHNLATQSAIPSCTRQRSSRAMGIAGLLPSLRAVTKTTHVRELKGLSVGVDAYCWLHRAVHSCATELCRGEKTDRWILFVLDRVDLLIKHGIKPFLVFDGDRLPAKSGKESERAARREENRKRGLQCLRQGSPASAHNHFSKAVDVTPAMAAQLMQVIKQYRPGVQTVVAPYEADAQLGFMCQRGIIDAVITEDSDLLLFGCSRVLFKLQRTGEGDEINLQDAFSVAARNPELDLRGKGPDHLLLTCVLSGCDYLPSVPGMGLKRAHRIATTHRLPERAARALRIEFGNTVPAGYESAVMRAMATFRHQVIFDTERRCLSHLNPLPLGHALGEDISFLGSLLPNNLACQIADGLVDPITRMPFEVIVDPPAPPLPLKHCPARLRCQPRKLIQQRTLKSFFVPVDNKDRNTKEKLVHVGVPAPLSISSPKLSVDVSCTRNMTHINCEQSASASGCGEIPPWGLSEHTCSSGAACEGERVRAHRSHLCVHDKDSAPCLAEKCPAGPDELGAPPTQGNRVFSTHFGGINVSKIEEKMAGKEDALLIDSANSLDMGAKRGLAQHQMLPHHVNLPKTQSSKKLKLGRDTSLVLGDNAIAMQQRDSLLSYVGGKRLSVVCTENIFMRFARTQSPLPVDLCVPLRRTDI